MSLISVVGLLIWYVLIARQLFLLAEFAADEGAHRPRDGLDSHSQ
ncbi:MAG TPA: hypothetical protein VFQ30_01955 [Ktedonobacteraceae bacterium]|nr:hypothetical protein [Ktedonobacteraceae bacterium]